MGLLDRMNREETRLGRINRINRKGFLKDWGRWLGIGAASLPFAFNVFAGNNADLEARTANDDNATVTIHVSDKKNE